MFYGKIKSIIERDRLVSNIYSQSGGFSTLPCQNGEVPFLFSFLTGKGMGSNF